MKSQGTTYKRCGCRTGLVPAKNRDGTPQMRGGKPVRVCPKLRSSRHGSWFWALRVEKDKPPVRKGGFSTQQAAQDALEEYKRLRGIGVDVGGDGKELFAAYFDKWLLSKGKLSAATRDNYRRNGELYLKPALGSIAIGELRQAHGDLMFTAIRLLGEESLPADHPARAEHARMKAVRKSRRLPGVAQMHRIGITLNSCMSSAVRSHAIPFNPMRYIELEDEVEAEALLWTQARVEEWQRTGKRPSPVMVWTAEQTGAFLDSIVDHRLYALFHLFTYRALRRGEGIGARWSDADLDGAVLYVREQIYRVSGQGNVASSPKAGSSGDVALDVLTVEVLREHKRAQLRLRMARGEAWRDTDRIFTNEVGERLGPEYVSKLFNAMVADAGLPPIRLHDLRHCSASLTYLATKDLKIVQRLLRHKVPAMSHRYTTLFADVESEAAEKAAATVPRRRVPTTFPQSGVADVIPAQFPTASDDVSAGQEG